MNGYVLDGCTLLNLYSAWGSLANLKDFSEPFHLGPAVASEILYVRDFDVRGDVATKNLTVMEMSRHYLPLELAPTPAEVELMVRLSGFLDDGEAEGLAIAASRCMNFCTDDGAVQKVIDTLGLRVDVTSTPAILLGWASDHPCRIGVLPALVKRITELGRFRPSRSSPHCSWWARMLRESSTLGAMLAHGTGYSLIDP